MADDFKPCSVDGCNGNAHWRARGKRGWCNSHYLRWSRHGDPLKGGSHRQKNPDACVITGCEKRPQYRGMCGMHYERWRTHGDPRPDVPPKGDSLRYLKEVVIPYTEDDCLLWPFWRYSHGYGGIMIAGKRYVVSRLVCKEIHGEPPTRSHDAAHSCGNGHLGCVNPKHLRWATRSENMMDRLQHGTHNRGERNPLAKMTEAKVRGIKALRGKMTQREIAARLGVTISSVNNVHQGLAWRWLD